MTGSAGKRGRVAPGAVAIIYAFFTPFGRKLSRGLFSGEVARIPPVPELPEVEVLKRSLEPRLVGRTIESVEVRAPALREPLDKRRLSRLAGRRIASLSRRAKYLLIEIAGGDT